MNVTKVGTLTEYADGTIDVTDWDIDDLERDPAAPDIVVPAEFYTEACKQELIRLAKEAGTYTYKDKKEVKVEQYQWDLTEDERAELKDREIRRRGQSRLLEQLQRLEGYETEREAVWWDAVMQRLGITPDPKTILSANYRTGKIWVKGKAPTMDNKPPRSQDL